jgi:DNA-binding NarL/FixJ family response regulator
MSEHAGVIRVLLVDDQALVRTGFRMILRAEPGIEVVGEAADGAQAVDAARRLRPDVVVMDVRMPHVDGIEATRRILAVDHTKVRVLMLTTFDLDEYVYEALRAGASGFLLKDGPAEQFVAAIRVVADGGGLLAPTVTRRLIEEFSRRPPENAPLPSALADLTARERTVLVRLARGLSNAEIAAELTLGEATVKTHVMRVLSKLGARNRTQAVVYAYESGLVRPGAGVGCGDLTPGG